MRAGNDSGRRRQLGKALGPGLMFAATAVGVSHLVQSTRAGAVHGLGLVAFILIANLTKYPAFRLAPHYTAATGLSLLEGFRRRGRWALVAYAVVTLGTAFVALAAVALITGALTKVAFGLSASPLEVALALIAGGALLVAVGRYHWLDRAIKVLVVLFALGTLVATALAAAAVDWSRPLALWPADFERGTVLFIAALVGWMPAPIDTAVWQSLWAQARARDSGHRATPAEAGIDFHLGYASTVVLALCFLFLGFALMHGRGVAVAGSAGAFAGQVVSLYVDTLGGWSAPIIATAAMAVMLSTLLTVLDGFPRSVAVLVRRFRTAEPEGGEVVQGHGAYLGALVALAGGSAVVLLFLLSSFRVLVDVATTISFLTAPVLAWLVHRTAFGPEVPAAVRPPRWLRRLSATCIVALAGFAVFYLFLVTGGYG